MWRPTAFWHMASDQKRPYLDLKDTARAMAFILDEDLFDRRIYNVLTQNATVSDIVDIILEFIPEIRVHFVDSPIMNQFSYEVSCERFTGCGFDFSGDLRKEIGEIISLLRNSNNINQWYTYYSDLECVGEI